MVLAAIEAAVERAPGAFGGAIDGDEELGLRVLDDDGGSTLEAHFDAALLIDAAARAIDVGEADDDAADLVQTVIQRVGKAP